MWVFGIDDYIRLTLGFFRGARAWHVSDREYGIGWDVHKDRRYCSDFLDRNYHSSHDGILWVGLSVLYSVAGYMIM